jgi:type VI secretion system secreted protein Hcp
MAAVDYFLKIDGIPGESQDSKHKDEIQLLSFSFGATQNTTIGSGGGAGAGKVAMQNFDFVMQVCRASPSLFLACCNGHHFNGVNLTCRKAGKEQQEYLKIKMTQVFVTSYQFNGDGASIVLPTDSIRLAFAKINYDYFIQNSDGTIKPGAQVGWDVIRNTQV